MNPNSPRHQQGRKSFRDSDRGGSFSRNGSENSQKFFQNSGHENPQRDNQNYREKQFYQGKKFQNYDKSQYGDQKHPSAWSKKSPSLFSTGVNAPNVDSHSPLASSDSYDHSYPQTQIGRDIQKKDQNNTGSNPKILNSSVVHEVPREPPVLTARVYNLKSIKVTGAGEEFDQVLKCMLDSHPENEKFLSKLLRCGNVKIETFEALVPMTSALSVNAPEFEMPFEQCFSVETVSSATEVQQSFTSDKTTVEPKISTTNYKSVSNEQVQNLEEEGAVGGTRAESSDLLRDSVCVKQKDDGNNEEDGAGCVKEDDAWYKQDETDWTENEKENLQTDNKQYEKRRPKYENQKRNNRRDQGKPQQKKVKEVSGDLFEAPKDTSLAHCVGADLRMGSGIAVTFKRDFKNQGELLDQKKGVGEVAILEHKSRFIYYLVTKKYSTGKPRYEDLEKSLKEMRDHCVANGVKELAMPRIGCGLDRLEWTEVRQMIEDIFSDVDISITIYNLSSDENYNPPRSRTSFVFRAIPLIDMESQTGFVFFGAEDGSMDECGKQLDNKFNFALDFRKGEKRVGTVLKFEKKSEYIYGLIIKKNESDPLSYVNLEKCLLELRKMAKKDFTYFIGFQAFCEANDDLATEKLVTLLRTLFFSSECEIHICYPQSLQHLCQGDERHATESNKNSEVVGKRGQQGRERKGGEGTWHQQGADKRKEGVRNWRQK